MDIRHDLHPSEIKELAALSFDDCLVFSLYLDLSVDRYLSKRQIEEQAASLIDSAIRKAENKYGSTPEVKDAIEDAKSLERFVELELSREGATALAAFVCRQEKLERCYLLRRPLRPRASFDRSPYVRPLNSLLTEYSHFGVILCNRRLARIMRFHLGHPAGDEVVVEDEVHGRHDQGGWAQARYARHIEREAHNHYKRMAQAAEKYFRENPVDHLVLAGPSEDLAEARKCLPASLEKLVVRELHLDVHSRSAEVAKVVDEIDAEVEAAEDEELVRSLREGLGVEKSVAGLAETLGAVSEGKARVLLVSRGYVAPGWRCKTCSALLAVGPKCGRCGSTDTERVDDVVEEAIQQVVKTSGEVELVSDSADLDVLGSIGALLRF